jgi:hypothetical protein
VISPIGQCQSQRKNKGCAEPFFKERLTMPKSRVFLATAAIALSVPAQAAYVVNIVQSGTDVVATGSGSINTSGLVIDSIGGGSHAITPVGGYLWLGAAAPQITLYGGVAGPMSFGPGFANAFSSSSGSSVWIWGSGGGRAIGVPVGYVSGSSLGISTSTWANSTIASLGATPGTYVWSWGAGVDADTFTLRIEGGPAVPEPATWAMMIAGFGLVGGVMRRTKVTAKLHTV